MPRRARSVAELGALLAAEQSRNAALARQVAEGMERERVARETIAATQGVLRAINEGRGDPQAVLTAILERAGRLLDADGVALRLRFGEAMREVAYYRRPGFPESPLHLSLAAPGDPFPMTGSPAGRAMVERRSVTVDDLDSIHAAEYPESHEFYARRAVPVLGRSMVVSPLLRQGESVGSIAVNRFEVRPFTPDEVRLLETFADQALIAIECARLFAEVEEKSRQLEEASQHKSQFLAAMSHELRTPLNAIIGYAEMLAEEARDRGAEQMTADLARINGAGQHLLSLINAVLDLSKIEAGKMELDPEEFALADLVKDVAAVARPLIEKDGNVLAVDCADDVGVMRADRTKVSQSVLNLLANAAKFTQQGTVTLRVGRDGEWVSVAVGDTGIGLTDEQLGRLFQEFSQAEVSTSRGYGGTGLGLALSRRFCRLMGGDIAVESALGRGSTFTIRLPARVVEPAVASTAS